MDATYFVVGVNRNEKTATIYFAPGIAFFGKISHTSDRNVVLDPSTIWCADPETQHPHLATSSCHFSNTASLISHISLSARATLIRIIRLRPQGCSKL